MLPERGDFSFFPTCIPADRRRAGRQRKDRFFRIFRPWSSTFSNSKSEYRKYLKIKWIYYRNFCYKLLAVNELYGNVCTVNGGGMDAAPDKPVNSQTMEANMTNTIETAKGLTFGTELEYTNISRERAARAIHTVVGGTVRYTGGSYDEWTVVAPDGRHWKAISDGSLTDRATSAEVVTPILKWDDLETLQAVVRALRHAGAKTPDCTSQHVHIGIADFNARQIANIARIFYKQEELILKAAGTLERRLQHYTRRTDRAFIERLERAKPTTREALNEAWFGYRNPTPSHYDGARYRDINLNNVWRMGTVEFRLFNGTTHAGEVKAHIQLCLAIAAKAKTAACASTKNQRPYNPASAKYDLRVFLLRLGLIGREFKNTRMHLMKRMPGSSAWKNGRPEGR